jgi:hypothetical protein
MRKENGEYNVYVLGKNGEARPDVNLQVQVMHKWFMRDGGMGQEHVLTTDKDGRVKLGKLKKVMGINVSARFLGLNQAWFIGNQNG